MSASKLIALASLAEYVLFKPYIIPAQDGTDFIGYCLCMAVLAWFAQIFTNRLTDAEWEMTKYSGIYGAVLGYAWLLFLVKYENRQIHHLLVANLAILGGVLLGAYSARNKKGGKHGGGRVSGGGGGGGPRVKTSKDIDSVRFMKPGQAGCCGMQNGFPVDN
ncbi:hypothetical protein CERZMDRAFT_104848 [Cercospora zeae-maydis SCOH1-5]|uniref:Uncharacterized protein n=1 Tax=Cercospora zeae-maydis SCOH1-5 TaxID=717836 RepID=A0A6A6FQF6_9PEZI|nr:hypothetical protein CERZMDRAFT_104848 [Cercospora zeae-maydis SCOH1-5]